MLFKELNIIDEIQKALIDEGYENPTPIQEQSIPVILEGRDILGCAQTGTGKTAAFAIPVLQNIAKNQSKSNETRNIKALVLAPTRELAIQIQENFDNYSRYMNVKNTVIFGGVSQKPQVKVLREGVDIVIATPGRLLDLMNQKYVDLSNVEYFILDEADRMFDMGMIHDVKKIVAKLPKVRQNLLFSATMPKEVKKMVDSTLKNPVKVEVAPVSSTIDTINQKVYYASKKEKTSLLLHILKSEDINSLLVFTRTKYGANNIVKDLGKMGIESQAIHGNKSQNARQLALSNFKEGKIKVLVATDIAARGIDVDGLSHVINYDLPDVPETYVHRIGRTGRAGHSGVAITFCENEEKADFRAIEKVIKKEIPVVENVEFERVVIPKGEPKETTNNKFSNRRNSNRNSGNRNSGNRNTEKRNSSDRNTDNNKKSTSNKPKRNWYRDKNKKVNKVKV